MKPFTKTEANRVRVEIEKHYDKHMIEDTVGKCSPKCRTEAVLEAVNNVIEARNAKRR